tara:strand:- start:192 stop:443 length:252 start_codon:yes stop_codon:yes gene_type:complete
MAKAKKIKEAQLKLVNEQQTKLNSYLKNIGILESQKMNIHTSIKELSVEIDATKKELEEEYGSININLEDGSFTDIEKEKDAE